jgi:murein DD-endopeptidase MepM/ murein hydrolase activator NlpD
LAHRGRQVRIGPVAFWIVVGTLVIMAVWTVGTGTYFAFKENVLTRLVGRQADMQFAYEDRISELRSQVDRIASRQLLDQEQVERKVEALLRRQSVLEQRSAAFGSGELITGSVPRKGRGDRDLKPSPIGDGAPAKSRDRDAHLRGGIEGALARAELSMNRVETHQLGALAALEGKYDKRSQTLRGVLADLGVNPAKASRASAVGGPFVPVKPPRASADLFDRQVYRVAIARAQVDRYTHALANVPVRKPITGPLDFSSSFGVRSDPFLGRPAMHTGLDMRGSTGDPVHATAAGTVVTAGWNGGYGKMVEIDHGNQFSTRYGHLSAINVRVGQKVKIGDVVGRIGSTGRSTGPHLHYETRINDEAVNPTRFLKAGDRLGAL